MRTSRRPATTLRPSRRRVLPRAHHRVALALTALTLSCSSGVDDVRAASPRPDRSTAATTTVPGADRGDADPADETPEDTATGEDPSSPDGTGSTAPAAADGPVPTADAGIGIGDPYYPEMGAPDIDVQAYDLTLSVDSTLEKIDATAEIDLIVTSPSNAVHLDLVGLTVDSATFDGAPASFARDGSDLAIATGDTVAAGSRHRLTISYHGVPQSVPDPVLAGLELGWVRVSDELIYVASETNGAPTWFPANDHPSDKATVKVTVTAPEDFTVVSNGTLRDRSDRSGQISWTWASEQPMATYLVTLAIGYFTLYDQTGPEDLAMVHAFPTEEAEAGRDAVAEVPDMISYFTENFGPYPFETYGTLVVGTALGYALETQTRSLFGVDTFEDPRIQAHELAHQWFGDSVSPARWKDVWLNEGFATYAEWMWEEHTGGASIDSQAERSRSDRTVPLADPGVDDLFGPAVYVRGAATLHALRGEVGDDVFFEILRTWVREYRNSSATTEDFISLVEKITDTSWTDFFDSWLRNEAWP